MPTLTPGSHREPPHVSTSTLAGRLLRFSQDSAVTDALLGLADLSGAPVPMGAPPSSSTATVLLRDPVTAKHVWAAAVTDPMVLTAMATSRRVDARRSAAGNMHTPKHLLPALVDEAHARHDQHMAAALCATTDPLQWMAHDGPWRALWTKAGPAVTNVVTQLETRQDADLTRAVLTASLRHTRLTASVAVSAAMGRQPLTLRSVLDHLSGDQPVDRDIVMRAVLAVLPDDADFGPQLATALVDWLDAGAAPWAEEHRALTRVRPLSPGTMDVLTRSGHSYLQTAALLATGSCLAVLSDEHLDVLVSSAESVVADHILGCAELRSRLDQDQLELLSGKSARRTDLLDSPDADRLTPRAQANILRTAATSVLGDWVAGRLRLVPTVEVATLLVTGDGRMVAPSAWRTAPRDLDDLVERLSEHIRPEDLTRPGVRDLLDAAPRTVLLLATAAPPDGNAFLAYLGERVRDRFGGHTAAWAALAAAAGTIDAETLTGLLDIVAALSATPDADTNVVG